MYYPSSRMFTKVLCSTNSTREFVEVFELIYRIGRSKFESKVQCLLFFPPLYRTHASPFTTPPRSPSLSRFHTVTLARPSQISRRSSTRRTRVGRSPIRKTPVLASLLSAASFYGACSESV